jgi:hypothetical protein
MFTWQRDDYDRLTKPIVKAGPLESDGMALFRNAAAYFEVAKKKTAYQGAAERKPPVSMVLVVFIRAADIARL